VAKNIGNRKKGCRRGANFGNISVRSGSGNSFLITKTKTALDEIQRDGVMEMPVFCGEDDTYVDAETLKEMEKTASSETPIHRRIYAETKTKAILHAHCPYAVVMSVLESEAGSTSIVPVDSEGKLFLKEIPIVAGGIGSEELAENTANALKNAKGVIVLGHGTIAIGETLEEAYHITAQMEHSAKIKYLYAAAKNIYR
jgi:Ribulose-5-phosphate 4-epimerase and related epimerases and aldolases